MDAVELLQSQIDVVKVLEHYNFENIKQNGTLIRACCALHGGDNPTAFVMNTENTLWYCHTGGCGGGDIFTLVEQKEGIEFKEAVQWLADFFDVDIEGLQIRERKEGFLRELQTWIKLMKQRTKKVEFQPYEIDTCGTELKNVKKFRNYKQETIEHFGLKYAEKIRIKKRDGTFTTLYNRLVFPIYWKGKQIGVSMRRIKSSDMPKWLHQPTNIETENLLYNYDSVIGKEKVVVVEGIVDVWAYHEIGVPAVATFGAHITEEQYRLLIKLGCDLIFSFDGDEAGRKATEKAIEMFRYKANMEVVPFNEGEDPDTISREELKERYENRRKKR